MKNVRIRLFFIQLYVIKKEERTKSIFTRVGFPTPTKISGSLRVVLHFNS